MVWPYVTQHGHSEQGIVDTGLLNVDTSGGEQTHGSSRWDDWWMQLLHNYLILIEERGRDPISTIRSLNTSHHGGVNL